MLLLLAVAVAAAVAHYRHPVRLVLAAVEAAALRTVLALLQPVV